MADVVNVGITDNDGNGDTLRAAFSQINTRFNELLGTIDGGDAWAPTTVYTATPVRQWVINSGQAYVAAENHTSGATFAADLAAGKWFAVDSAQILADLAESTGAGMVGFSPTGTIASTTVQTAIAEINTDLASSSGASLVGYLPAGTGAVDTTVQGKLRESVSVKDFGAVGDGVTDDTAAIQAALFSGSKKVKVPTGAYLISAKLYIPAEVELIGDVVGIGGDGARGATFLAADSLTDFMLENWSITAAPLDPWWHGGRVKNISFRNNAGLRLASGFNAGPCGDMSSAENCKFLGLNVGLKIGGTGTNQGVQVACKLDTISAYSCNTGIQFLNCGYSASIKNLMLDGCTIPVHFKDCSITFHCTVDQWHAENMPVATELFYVENCNGSYVEVRSGSFEATGAASTISVVRITRGAASNKARVKVANAFTTNSSNYLLKDDDQSISWTQTEVGFSYGEINHNFSTVISSGQGGPIFGKSYLGNWTPVISDATTGGNLGTCTNIAAKFQRIGNMVFVQGNLTTIGTAGLTAGNQLFVQGLPFAANGSFNRQVGSAVGSNIAAGSIYSCSVAGGQTSMRLTKTANADVLVSDVTSGTGNTYFSLAYTI